MSISVIFVDYLVISYTNAVCLVISTYPPTSLHAPTLYMPLPTLPVLFSRHL